MISSQILRTFTEFAEMFLREELPLALRSWYSSRYLSNLTRYSSTSDAESNPRRYASTTTRALLLLATSVGSVINANRRISASSIFSFITCSLFFIILTAKVANYVQYYTNY